MLVHADNGVAGTLPSAASDAPRVVLQDSLSITYEPHISEGHCRAVNYAWTANKASRCTLLCTCT